MATQVQLTCIGWQVFSLKIDLHCHIVLEHHFRISGIPISKLKKLSQGVASVIKVGGVCVWERECWATPKTALFFSRSPSTGRCVWGRKDVISCVLPRLLRITLDSLAVLSDRPTPMLELAASCKGAWQSKKRTTFHSVQFSRSAMSDSLRPHGLQHARPPHPSPTPGVYPNSCPLSRWYHPTISSSVVPFSSCLQSFLASGSFQMCQLFP